MEALTPHLVAQLRARSMCADKTIGRWWRGQTVRDASRVRLEQAARELGVVAPQSSTHAA